MTLPQGEAIDIAASGSPFPGPAALANGSRTRQASL